MDGWTDAQMDAWMCGYMKDYADSSISTELPKTSYIYQITIC